MYLYFKLAANGKSLPVLTMTQSSGNLLSISRICSLHESASLFDPKRIGRRRFETHLFGWVFLLDSSFFAKEKPKVGTVTHEHKKKDIGYRR